MSVSVEPLARSLGITPSGFGFWTWPSTTVRTAFRCRPSAMLVRKTSSRSGPTMPLVSAWASVWHEPHLATNACLPTIRFASSPPLTAQPAVPSASATSSATPPMRLTACRAYGPSPDARLLARGKLTAKPYPTRRRAGKILGSRRGAGAHGSSSASRSPLAAAITPRATPSHDQRSRTVATSPARVRARSSASADSQPMIAAASARTASSSTANDSHAAASAGIAPREHRADLGEARVRRADRHRAACRRLGGDHPERLGKRARHDHRLAGGEQIGELLVLESARSAPGARSSRARGPQVARALDSPAGCRGTPADDAAAAQAARRPRAPGRPAPARAPARDRPRRGPRKGVRRRPGRHRSRRRPGVRRASPRAPAATPRASRSIALADDQLAHERHQRVALGVEPRDGASGAEQIARERVAVGRLRRARLRLQPAPAPRRRAAARRARARRRRRGRARAAQSASTSTPGGPSRVRRGSSGSASVLPQAERRVARADEHRARRAPAPRARTRGSAPVRA